MSFKITCPVCGQRPVGEFRFGGEARPRPDAEGDRGLVSWGRYLYFRQNTAGNQQEWWFHTSGCRRWFTAVRNTWNNQEQDTDAAGVDITPAVASGEIKR